ncbi:MAG: lamin tail domain-containing protein [Bacteroidota bacterium]
METYSSSESKQYPSFANWLHGKLMLNPTDVQMRFKLKKTSALLLFWWIGQGVAAQVTDDFSDSDFTVNPSWTGESGKFEVLAGQLHLNDTDAGEAYLSTASQAIAEAEWNFRVEISANPSSANFASVYLVSDQSDFSGNLNGYFVKIGDTSDEVSLYRQDGSTETEIIDGADDRVDVNPVQIEVKVTRGTNGNWELSSRLVGDTNFSVEGSAQDDTHTVSNYFGVYCKYTSTRSDAFYFDDISVTGIPQPDIQSPQVTALSVQSPVQINLQFSEAISAATAESITNYTLVGRGIASASQVNSEVTLTLNSALDNAVDYALTVRNVEDEAGNVLADTTIQFFYFQEVAAQWNDVIVSECMPDPNPVKADLPDAEFVELYNRSAHPFDLTDWQLNGRLLPTYILRPQQFVILCAKADSALFASLGTVLPLDSWPTLSNSGTELVLQDDSDNHIDSISYTSADVVGGISLERISEETPCDQRTNVALSLAEQGATPGQTNTVVGTSDTDPPELLSIQPVNDTLKLIFDERVSDLSLLSESVMMQPSIATDQIWRDTADEKVLWVTLAEELVTDTNYELTFLNAEDCYGNLASSQTVSFYFDNEPPVLQRVVVRDTAEVEFIFSEQLDESLAENESNYLLLPDSISPKSATLEEDSSSVWLTFSQLLADGITYQLQLHSLADNYGNTIDTLTAELRYHQAIDTVIPLNEYQVDVYFREAISSESAGRTSAFSVNREVGQPLSAFRDDNQPNLVHLVFSNPLTPNREHELFIEELLDAQGRQLSTPIYRFYFDRQAPRINSVQAIDEKTLLVYFDEVPDSLSATNILHYQLDTDSIEVTRVILLRGNRVVRLTLNHVLTPEVGYELEVLGIADLSGNSIDKPITKAFVFDQHPPQLLSWRIINPHQLRLCFSEAVTTEPATSFELKGTGVPDSMWVSRIQPNEVRLFFSQPLPTAETLLTVSGVTDSRGNRQLAPSSVLIDNAVAQLGLVTALSSTVVRLDFTQPLSKTAMLELSHYRVNQELPIEVTALEAYALKLTLNQSLREQITSILSVEEVVNIEGQTFSGVVDSFVYQTQVEHILTEERAVVLYFEVPLDSAEAVKPDHYHLEGETPVAVLWVDERTVHLVFAQPLAPLTRYELALNGLKNIDGDVIPASTHSVGLGRVPGFNELLIAEIMADPNPPVGLPEAEYLEFFNASDDLLDIGGLRLSDGTSSVLLPSVLLLPGEYLIVCASADQEKLSIWGRTVGVSGFPSLNSRGDEIRLTDSFGGEVFSVMYSDSWYNDAEKKQGGWSLEMIDITRPCGEQENWTASMGETGGTPGQENSVKQSNPDNQPPVLQQAFAISPSEVVLTFSERLNHIASAAGQVSVTPAIAVDTIIWQADRKTLSARLRDLLGFKQTYSVAAVQFFDCSGNEIEASSVSFVLSEEAEVGDVLLSEVLFYPRSGGVKFVEVYNHSDKPINLKGWQLANQVEDSLTNVSDITSENYQLSSQQYVALTEDATTLIGDYPSAFEGNLLVVEALPSLPSDAGTLVLLSPEGDVMQRLDYEEGWHHPILDDVRGVSLERISWDADVNDPNNWQSAAQTVGFATPGYVNSQLSTVHQTSATLSVEPKVFTPDQDGFQDYAQIHYRWATAGNVANVIIFDSQGRKVRHLARNTMLGEQGFLRWDGTGDTQQPLPMGYYLIYFEVFHTNGQVSVLKEKVVLGRPF